MIMVFPFLMPHYTNGLLGVWYILPWLGQILPMQSKAVSRFVGNPCKPHLIAVHRIFKYIRGTPMNCSTILPPLYGSSCFCWCWLGWMSHTQQSITGWCMFLAHLLSHGGAKSNPQSPNPLLKSNTDLCPLPITKPFGFAVFSVRWVLWSLVILLSILTLLVWYKLLTILFSTSNPRTLKKTVILFDDTFSLVCFIFLMLPHRTS